MAVPRVTWRGTMMVKSPGKPGRISLWASAAISSSPGWVLAASHSGRPALSFLKAASSFSSAGRGGMANLRLPGAATLTAPRAVSLSASPRFWPKQSSNEDNSCPMVRGKRRQLA